MDIQGIVLFPTLCFLPSGSLLGEFLCSELPSKVSGDPFRHVVNRSWEEARDLRYLHTPSGPGSFAPDGQVDLLANHQNLLRVPGSAGVNKIIISQGNQVSALARQEASMKRREGLDPKFAAREWWT
ncbi:uncharacterized protein BO80DRAFT_180964 [Aspergillus ibericus CBS 121593]|uniref:Uncharacterized protein n=1 Tax=Aspergillus ibericus CBS 121593 TaxID=1448316 RepID=A0A395GQN2_9EURO|nr:hypothetical protein BO80DRAFT_180964 [Aspergillus ibericus CBS 121593]RAK97789.1 hypothetical protein BO80DRAFT_180964 [Aspergillus ibericus CBS 121593]